MILVNFLISANRDIDGGVLKKWSDKFFKIIFSNIIIAVNETNKFTTRQFETLVAGGRETGI